ncbi:type IV secretion system DNA-binding domain-containing protein [Escherichia coli]|nr:type IV secretion system DNA-binding domain-containing protein [Escherichia coli]
MWFFCDELPTLHKLPDLVEILPEARKFGGCCGCCGCSA